MIIDDGTPVEQMSPERTERWIEVLRGMSQVDFIIFKLVAVRRLGVAQAARRVRASKWRARLNLLRAIHYLDRNQPP